MAKCPYNATKMSDCDNCKTMECIYELCSKCHTEQKNCNYEKNAETQEMEYVCDTCKYGWEQELDLDCTVGTCRYCFKTDSLNEEEMCFDCYYDQTLALNERA